MTARPSLARSIPFWALVAVSVASKIAGVVIVSNALTEMSTKLLDGTATGVEVYVGQPLAVVGGVLIGAGVVGILLALAVAAIGTLRPKSPVEVVEPIDWTEEVDTEAELVDAEPRVEADAPVEPIEDAPAAR